MAFRAGRFSEITVSGVNISAYCDSIELSREVEMLETTTFTKTSKTYVTGLMDATVSVGGKYDNTVVNGPATLFTSLLGAPHTVPVKIWPGGSSPTPQQTRSFDAILVSYSESTAVGDIVKFAADLQVSDVILASGL